MSALQRTAEITTEQINMLVGYVSSMLIGEQGLFWHMTFNLRISHIHTNIYCDGRNSKHSEVVCEHYVQQLWLSLWCADILGIMPEVSIDPMQVVQDAVLGMSDKKDRKSVV